MSARLVEAVLSATPEQFARAARAGDRVSKWIQGRGEQLNDQDLEGMRLLAMFGYQAAVQARRSAEFAEIERRKLEADQ